MKTITTLALGAILVGSAGIAEAGPLDFLFGGNRHDHRDDHRHEHRDDRYHDRDHGRRPMSTEARAQLRLRELGYYRGPVDGSFGRSSKASLIRFQRDRHLRPTGWLDERTRRALRI
ncbi:MAG TPA: peptidoglycan-binding domain-containing protein [Luteolibacter sp.]|nr:peptidoglycan-binding domain-containing protein [Luteolibacter sp.]